MAETRPIQKIIVTLTMTMSLGWSSSLRWTTGFGWSRVPAVIVVTTNIIIIATSGFFARVLRENHLAASTITVEAGHCVISSGPYRYARHPMYGGALLLVLAIPFALGFLVGIAGTCDQ